MAMTLPRTGDAALWIAFGTALCALRSDFQKALENLPPLHPGQKLLFDGRKVVEFVGEDRDNYSLRMALRGVSRSCHGRSPTDGRAPGTISCSEKNKQVDGCELHLR